MDNSNQTLIGGIVTDHISKTAYPYKIRSINVSWMVDPLKVKVKPCDLYELAGGNPVLDFN